MDLFMLLAQETPVAEEAFPWLMILKAIAVAVVSAAGPAVLAWMERRKSAKATLLAKAGQFLIEWVEEKGDKALKQEIAAKSVEKKQSVVLDAAVQQVTDPPTKATA